jgi:hypothetical protein
MYIDTSRLINIVLNVNLCITALLWVLSFFTLYVEGKLSYSFKRHIIKDHISYFRCFYCDDNPGLIYQPHI